MKILVIGGGGREHAIVWKLAQSPKKPDIYCAPGNGGIRELATCVDISVMDFESQIKFAKEKEIDLTIIAPDDPLVAGGADKFTEAGLRVFGPNQAAAIIEGSKSFAKDLMKKYSIPTAAYEVFEDYEKAVSYIEKSEKYPLVIKADGLALGKGVIIAQTREEALNATERIMESKMFGKAGNRVVIEEFLTGPEMSVLAFTDGKSVVPMESAQDHKRALDGDRGLNTGGMGTFSPSGVYTDAVANECMERIFLPTIKAMKEEGRAFKGVLYFGLMKTERGVKVIEYNARFGDPETQVVLPRLKTDLIDIIDAVIDERLDALSIEWEDNATVCVILASGGYPQEYQTGYPITGLDKAKDTGAIIFHAGTKFSNENLVTSGGRVLGVTASSDTTESAAAKAYEAVKLIDFTDKHFRSDIGVTQK